MREGEGALRVLTQQSSLVARLGKALGEQEHQNSEELWVRGAGLSFHRRVQFLISRNGHFYFHMCFVLF